METLATRFRVIMDGLRAAIGMHVARDRTREAVFALLWHRIGRMTRRFEALFTRWQAGKLPKPRPSRAGQPRTPRAPSPRLPRGRTWVVAQIGYHAAGRASQLQHLLADPDMAEFLHAAPQAGRLLRPLCHILGIDPPPPLKSPVNALSVARAGRGCRRQARAGATPPTGRATRLSAPPPAPIVSPPRFVLA